MAPCLDSNLPYVLELNFTQNTWFCGSQLDFVEGDAVWYGGEGFNLLAIMAVGGSADADPRCDDTNNKWTRLHCVSPVRP